MPIKPDADAEQPVHACLTSRLHQGLPLQSKTLTAQPSEILGVPRPGHHDCRLFLPSPEPGPKLPARLQSINNSESR